MVELLGEGKALLFYSSETEEMAHLCHRVLVMREGGIAAELAGPEADAEALVAAVAEGACRRLSATAPIAPAAAGGTSLVQRRRCCSRCAILAGTLGVYIGALLLPTLHRLPDRFDWTSLLNTSLPLVFAAVGQSVVVLTRGLDLSVGGMIALCGTPRRDAHGRERRRACSSGA